MKRLARALVRLYQVAISPLFPPCCRYHPTCSAYARAAFDKHGATKGFWLTAQRLSRCHPWGGDNLLDPAPERFDWRPSFLYKRRNSHTTQGFPES